MNKEKIELILKFVRENKITNQEAILLMEDKVEYCPTIIPHYNKDVEIKIFPYDYSKGPGDTPDTWNNVVSSTSSVIYKDGKIYSLDDIDTDTCSDFERYLRDKNAENN